jgi:hypothetical protein
MGLQAAIISTNDGDEIIAVAVRPSVLADEQRRQGVLDTLAGLFPGQQIVLIASTSKGFEVTAEIPELAASVQKKRIGKLHWRSYTAVPA